MPSFLLGGLLAAATGAQAATCGNLEPVRWLLGDWAAEQGETLVLETWREASTATFEGRGLTRSRADGRIVDGEELRLVAMAEAVFYVAKVAHNEYPVAFRLVECGPSRLVFENPAHDFPRRLEYARQADGTMLVSVSDGAQRGFELHFRRRD